VDAARLTATTEDGTSTDAVEDVTELTSLVAAAAGCEASWRGNREAARAKLTQLEIAEAYAEIAQKPPPRALTREQRAIVAAELTGAGGGGGGGKNPHPRDRRRPPRTMIVSAFAGTGKTSTLIEYARRRPGYAFAYVTFNRAVCEDAKTRFPGNTTCVNFHSLAFRKWWGSPPFPVSSFVFVTYHGLRVRFRRFRQIDDAISRHRRDLLCYFIASSCVSSLAASRRSRLHPDPFPVSSAGSVF
jgi:hypothetical protein